VVYAQTKINAMIVFTAVLFVCEFGCLSFALSATCGRHVYQWQ